VGPRYEEPQLHTPEQYQSLPKERAATPLSEPRASPADLSMWWTQLRDPQLDRLVQHALSDNLDLQAASLRVREAREQEVIAGAAYYPSVALSGAAARFYFQSNPVAALGGSGNYGQSGSSGSRSLTDNLYFLGFDASWEADLFGGTRRSVEAARASTQASLWQLADAEVSLTAEVANAYLSLRATQARIAILNDSIRHQQEQLVIVEARARTGFVTELDVNQQRTQLAATQALLPTLEAEEAAMIHALGVLLGEDPGALAQELAGTARLPSVPTNLPVGIPADLLRRRPDVRRAERQLAAATANIGVAVANYFPKVNLLALPALAGSTPGDLFSSHGFGYITAAAITWPLFEGSKLRANVRVSKERRAEAYLAYRQAVLSAMQEAEDALARYSAEQRRLLALEESQTAAASSLHISQEQYKAGLVTFINVLTASSALLNEQDQVAQSEQALAQDLVSVYKALGGGWGTGDGRTRAGAIEGR
jgi:NodT family efflux transporter outer membrane factor (OMF) lipoprotein